MKVLRGVLIVLISSFIGIITNPELPFASDSVAVTALDDSRAVETVVLPEPVAEIAEEPTYAEPDYGYAEPVYEEVYYEEPAYEEPVYTAPANNITINGRYVDLAYTDNTGEDAGGAALAWYYKTGKFIYGHNSWNVFGFLDSAYDGGWLLGMTFSVTMDGATSYYTVANYRLYDYDASQPKYLWYNGESYKMNPIVKASLDGTSYRMAIMTCYAGSSKRLVIFAN